MNCPTRDVSNKPMLGMCLSVDSQPMHPGNGNMLALFQAG